MNRTKRLVILWGMVIANLAGDFFLPLSVPNLTNTEVGVMLALLLTGCLVAQVGILSAWGVLANQPAIVRVPMTLGIFTAGNCLLLFGFRVVDPGFNANVVATITAVTVIIVLGTQIPLWLTLVTTRRRIGLKSETTVHKDGGRISIRYLLVATGVIAALLALTLAVAPEGSVSIRNRMWPALIGIMCLFSLFSAALTIPSLWMVLSESAYAQRWAAIGLLVAWGGGLVVLAITFTEIGFFSDVGYGLMVGIAFSMGAVGAMVGELYVMRSMGYRLLHQRPDGSLSLMTDSP